MAQVKMYSKKDKRFVNFPIACTPSDEECKKCQLKFTCDKAKIKTTTIDGKTDTTYVITKIK
nr:MAG TPA: hypothetical protein [Caudoviricetes sp.]